MQMLFKKDYDRGARLLAKDLVLQRVLNNLWTQLTSVKPPKTAGREEFGDEYAQRFCVARSRREGNVMPR